MFNSQNHWRNTARPVKFFNVDYRAGIFLFIFMMHIRLWTFIIFILMMIIFWLLERRGLSIPIAASRIRCWFLGPFRPALGKIHHRAMTDNGGN
jgi:intracellular multiplication protein IcmT